MEITPEVNNYIRHKLIRFAKGHQRVQKVTENAQTTIDLSQERDERREIPAGSEASAHHAGKAPTPEKYKQSESVR